VSERPEQTYLEQLGGISGLVQSSLPILAFVPLNAVWGLTAAIWGALGIAAAIFVWRVVKKDPVQPAISGFIGVGICAFIAYRTGDAKGYFLLGIYTSLVYGAVFVLSVLLRWPIIGVIWSLLNGKDRGWRANKTALRAYDVATLAWAVVFAARYFVQAHLYDTDQTGWLAFARIAMGWPLAALALLVTVLYVRRADHALGHRSDKADPDTEPADADVADPGAANPERR
jgi:hypothetical protein